MTSTRVGLVSGGASYHERTAGDGRFAARLERSVYLPRLERADLDGLDVVVLADRLHPGLVARHGPLLLEVPATGGTLVVLGADEGHGWLPGASWEPRATNFWWWREGSDSRIRARHPEHPLWSLAAEDDLVWHFHGVLRPPPVATPLLVVEEDGGAGVLLYDDSGSTPGRLVVTTLDPVYHHGSNFMPAATRFLDVVLEWLGATPAARTTASAAWRRR